MDEQTHGWIDKHTNGQTDKWTNAKRTNGQRDNPKKDFAENRLLEIPVFYLAAKKKLERASWLVNEKFRTDMSRICVKIHHAPFLHEVYKNSLVRERNGYVQVHCKCLHLQPAKKRYIHLPLHDIK